MEWPRQQPAVELPLPLGAAGRVGDVHHQVALLRTVPPDTVDGEISPRQLQRTSHHKRFSNNCFHKIPLYLEQAPYRTQVIKRNTYLVSNNFQYL
ncbi:Protein of unknown function [Gryllus bimaculatus]|nr:Protein of unknown function [Gryllus bimaculatus]